MVSGPITKSFNNLMTSHNANLACFKETFLKDTNQLNIKNYQQYSRINKDEHKSLSRCNNLRNQTLKSHQLLGDLNSN